MIISYWILQIVQIDSFYVADSPLSITNIAELGKVLFKLSSLNDYSMGDGPVSPTGQFK